MRYIMMEQLLGLVFEYLTVHEIKHISIAQFFRISREVDIKVRENNKAMVCMSLQELYQAVDMYNVFFEIDKQQVKLRNGVLFNHDDDSQEQMGSIRQMLQLYLCDTIPKDICETIKSNLGGIVQKVLCI